MGLGDLRVYHHQKGAQKAAPSLENILLKANPEPFILDTCQRIVMVSFSELKNLRGQWQVLKGVEAYSFLLQTATGLKSQIRGESDVFGQFKEAWKNYYSRNQHVPESQQLDFWMQKIFEDTKEIRSSHLQKTGGSSYGSISRRLLRTHSVNPANEPVLLIGAGQLAKSIAPWLLEHPLLIWNRTAAKTHELLNDLLPKSTNSIEGVLSSDEEAEAWAKAVHVVICVPISDKEDKRRIKNWTAKARSKNSCILHLGAMAGETKAWNGLENFHALDDLFSLQKLQNEARTGQFARAVRACDQKARLRILSDSAGGSLSLPHGWEDLALFA